MDSFLLALQFLTVIPVKIKDMDEAGLSRAMAYFPLVGLLLGLVLAGINNILLFLGFGQFICSIILVICLASLTGGLHLDGLSDTVDAFSSNKNKEETLKIMRDSHIGTMGALSLISIILLKIAFLFSITASFKAVALVLMCVLSRWALVFASVSFPYARGEGKAKPFIQGANLNIFILATVVGLVCAILAWGLKGLLVFGIITMSVYLINKFINHKLGGITGDTLGATSEIVEVITLFSICLLQGVNLWIR